MPGLFAAGEVACVSVHGANRLGTNSLLDINVFGRRGGLSAAAYANSHDFVDLPPSPEAGVVALLQRHARRQRHRERRGDPQGAAGDDGHQRVRLPDRGHAQAGRGRPRRAQGRATLGVGVSDRGKRYNTELLEAVELGFLLDLAEALVVSAKARNESRGGHFREDYPTRDDVNFMRHTMAYKVGEGPHSEVRLDYKPVVQTRYEPMERKY